jgi:hypothetical protein
LTASGAAVPGGAPSRPGTWLVLCIVLAGAASIALRQDSSWDLLNYHYYNAWAFVHGRHGIDWAPAQLQTFYSPFLDLPFYAMVAAGLPPMAVAFALAIPTGVGWYCFARMAGTLFPGQRAAAIGAIAIGVTAPMSVSLIGTTMNDWYVAALVMVALWLVVRGTATPRTLAAAGALVGLAAGLKLTGVLFGIGLLAGVAMLGDDARERLRHVLVAGGAMAAAFAVAAGPWMWLMAERFGNPLFPYYNDIFRSPWADPVRFTATRFGPRSLLEWAIFPYEMLWKLEGFVSEPEFRDARPALLYTLALAALVVRPPAAPGMRREWRFLGAFLVASFLAWAVMYRIFRYLVPLEMVAALFIARFIARFTRGRHLAIALGVAFAGVVVTAKFPTWWRQRFEEQFFVVAMPPVKPNALVLLVAPEPMSYVLPSFPADARFAGLVSNFNDPGRTNRLQAAIAASIRDHDGPLYALAVPPGRDAGAAALARMGLARASCATIQTNMRVSPLELCELRRQAPAP